MAGCSLAIIVRTFQCMYIVDRCVQGFDKVGMSFSTQFLLYNIAAHEDIELGHS